MRRTNLPGHALRSGGAAFIPAATCGGRADSVAPDGTAYTRCRGHIGYGLCECGTLSPTLHSAAARQRWHRDQHKPQERLYAAVEHAGMYWPGALTPEEAGAADALLEVGRLKVTRNDAGQQFLVVPGSPADAGESTDD